MWINSIIPCRLQYAYQLENRPIKTMFWKLWPNGFFGDLFSFCKKAFLTFLKWKESKLRQFWLRLLDFDFVVNVRLETCPVQVNSGLGLIVIVLPQFKAEIGCQKFWKLRVYINELQLLVKVMCNSHFQLLLSNCPLCLGENITDF